MTTKVLGTLKVGLSSSLQMMIILSGADIFVAFHDRLFELEDQPQYQNLTVDPNGNFILADYYNFEKVTRNIKNKETIDSPVKMDMIEFKGWKDGKLEFTCDEFLNWDRHLTLTYDSETSKIEIITAT